MRLTDPNDPNRNGAERPLFAARSCPAGRPLSDGQQCRNIATVTAAGGAVAGLAAAAGSRLITLCCPSRVTAQGARSTAETNHGSSVVGSEPHCCEPLVWFTDGT